MSKDKEQGRDLSKARMKHIELTKKFMSKSFTDKKTEIKNSNNHYIKLYIGYSGLS